MSIESLIDNSGQQMPTITAWASASSSSCRSDCFMGGADRSDGNWLTVAGPVPCLVRTRSSALNYNRNDERAAVIDARIYFGGRPRYRRASARGTGSP